MRLTLTLLFSFVSSLLFAQNSLLTSRRTSAYTYVYALDPAQSHRIWKTKSVKEWMPYLQALQDSFPTGEPIPKRLPAGSYLLMHTEGGSMVYSLYTAGPLTAHLINGAKDLQVVVLNAGGDEVSDAKLTWKNKSLRYDAQTRSYRAAGKPRRGTLRIERGSAVQYATLSQNDRQRKFRMPWTALRKRRYNPYYSFQRITPNEAGYRGFMVFSKPRYKPGDTLQAKAFVVTKGGKPLSQPLRLRLWDGSLDTDTVLQTLKPYRAGGYTWSLPITDSLDLDLDERYYFTLEQEGLLSVRKAKRGSRSWEDLDEEDQKPLRRKVVMRGDWEHEEYELGTIRFAMRGDKEEHSRGERNTLYFRGTDENDLPLLDARVEITIRPSEPHFDTVPHFLPDTLWRHSLTLDPVGETALTLPDSIFPAAGIAYSVQAEMYTAANERESDNKSFRYLYLPGRIDLTQDGDSLRAAYFVGGVQERIPAKLLTLSAEGDTLKMETVSLPWASTLAKGAKTLVINTGSQQKSLVLRQRNNTVQAGAERVADTLYVQLQTGGGSSLWYTIYEGKRVWKQGATVDTLLRLPVRSNRTYSLAYAYLSDDGLVQKRLAVRYLPNNLSVSLQAPPVIYPGQTATLTVEVKDERGKPIVDADVTAWAITKKFGENTTPNIPYLGTWPKRYSIGNNYSLNAASRAGTTEKLDWKYWHKRLGLDSIEYYRFLYPDTVYRGYLPAPGGITQVSPYVVVGGQVQPVHILYIDEVPHFFAPAKGVGSYAFEVDTARRHLYRIRTADRMVTFLDGFPKWGVKTIVSINGDTSNKAVGVQLLPDTLSAYESDLMRKYTILLEEAGDEEFVYLRNQGRILPINLEGNRSPYHTPPPVLVGPLMGIAAEYVKHTGFRQDFELEGGYQYRIRPEMVRLKQYAALPFSNKLATPPWQPHFVDSVLTANDIEALWERFLEMRAARQSLYRNPYLRGGTSGRLQLRFEPLIEAGFVKQILLFRYDNPDFTHSYAGSTRDFGSLNTGFYRAMILLSGNRFVLADSLLVRSGGINFYPLSGLRIREADSTSRYIGRELAAQRAVAFYRPPAESITEAFNQQYFNSGAFTGTVSGVVRDDKGSPIPFATVSIRNTRQATTANENGRFQIRIPSSGTLVASAVGYGFAEQAIGAAGFYEIILYEADMSLQEVVVVGYGMVSKRDMVGSVSVIRSSDLSLSGRVSGVQVQIRGASSVSGDNSPLYIVDGLIVSSPGSIDPNGIASTTVIKSEQAVALYGSIGINGAIVITTKAAAATGETGGPTGSGNGLRTRFRDDAYWQPTLRTGPDGKVSFTATFPDDITAWRTHTAVITANRQSGYHEGAIRAFKPLSAALQFPLFAVHGDTLSALGKVQNYTGDTVALRRRYYVQDSLRRDDQLTVVHNRIDTLGIIVPAADSLKLKYTLAKADGYFDGEERRIPLFRPGVLQTDGFFAALDGDTSFTFTPNAAGGPVVLRAEASVLPTLIEEAENIRKYEYLCNEQLASKLKALMAQKRLRKAMDLPFAWEKNIEDVIKRLQAGKKGPMWGWWPAADPQPWISLHAVEALLDAEEAGYKTGLVRQPIIDYLQYSLDSYRPFDRLLTLQTLHRLGAATDFPRYLDSLTAQQKLDSRRAPVSLYNALRLTELRQLRGLSTGIDTLLPKAKKTLFGNLYWGDEGYRFWDNSVQNTVLMYRILRRAGGHERELRRIRHYFLEQRRNGAWRNTYESSLILETIMPDLLGEDRTVRPSTLRLGNDSTVRTFPFEKTLPAGGSFAVTKEGSMPVYFTAYQKQWDPAPVAASEGFRVASRFVSAGQTIGKLKGGKAVTLEVTVVAEGDGDYVLVEIPIPAGCSYASKNGGWGSGEVHREHFLNKVSIFCEKLRQGRHTFRVELMPRYSGRYVLNPAKAELMYFPVFFGREGMKRVAVE